MKCSGCFKSLDGRTRYFTLLCNNEDVIFTFTYCNPMCIALDWNCMEAEV